VFRVKPVTMTSRRTRSLKCILGACGDQAYARGLSVATALLLALVGCVEPTQAGWLVPIAPGAANRLCVLGSRCDRPSTARVAPAAGGAQARSEQVRVTATGDAFQLENAELRAAVSGCPVVQSNSDVSGIAPASCSLRLHIANVREANLEVPLQLHLNGAEVSYQALRRGRVTADECEIVALGVHNGQRVTTRVLLRDGERGLAISHEFAGNEARFALRYAAATDAQAFVLGQALGFRGSVASAAFIAAIEPARALVFASTGDDIAVASTGPEVRFEPSTAAMAGGGTRAEWVLLLGHRGDSASAMAEVWRASGMPLAPVDVVVDYLHERVIIGQRVGAEFLSARAYPGPNGISMARAELPPGDYRLRSSRSPVSDGRQVHLGNAPLHLDWSEHPPPADPSIKQLSARTPVDR
jgi:hypothetical protein